MKIALDAMGGDFAPRVTVEGAVEAVNESPDLDIDIVLVGQEDLIKEELRSKRFPPEKISIKHASQIVSMDEPISTAIRRKKDSSIRRGIELVKSGETHAFVSAGHSGVVMSTALFCLGTSDGVDRPAIAATMPKLKGRFILIDAGANVDTNASNLLQFALMGCAYCSNMLGVENPKVAILNIGEEDTKGNDLTKEAFSLIKNTNLNFVGNIEGKDIFSGNVDVVVCDGFIGNVALKISEGLAETILKMLKQEIAGIVTGRLAYMFMKPALRNFKKKMDYAEYGGAPLLGIKGTCIISHGRSSSKAIRNAIKIANRFAELKVEEEVSSELNKYSGISKNKEGGEYC